MVSFAPVYSRDPQEMLLLRAFHGATDIKYSRARGESVTGYAKGRFLPRLKSRKSSANFLESSLPRGTVTAPGRRMADRLLAVTVRYLLTGSHSGHPISRRTGKNRLFENLFVCA